MSMKYIIGFFFFILIGNKAIAQLPNCAGADSSCLFLQGTNEIYKYDPALPLSATNPSVFLSNTSAAAGGLTISYNLNGSSVSPTFYSTSGNYVWFDGTTWVNTGHSSSTVNLGGGVNVIYGKNGGTGYISKYDGSGNDVFFANGTPSSGPYDLVTDSQDNLYEIDISGTIGYIYKYNTAGVIIDTIVVLNVPPQSAGPGFAIIGNTVYMGINSTPNFYSGQIVNDTVNATAIGTLTLGYGDFASCPSMISSNPSASLVYTTCNGQVNIPISSPMLVGAPTFLWNFDDPSSGVNNISTLGNATHTFQNDGVYNVTLIITSSAGIDTIVNTLTINHTVYGNSSISICEPNSYQGYSATGIYTDTLQNQFGCDSVHTLNLTVSPLKFITIDTTICYGKSAYGYSTAGTFTDVFTSSKGCDSTRTLNLTILPKIETFLVADICDDGNYLGYNQTGQYTDIFTSVLTGCDSTRYIDLTVHNSPDVSLEFAQKDICKGDTIRLHAAGANSYKWFLNSDFNPVSTSADFDLQVNDHVYVTLEGVSTFGCVDRKSNTFIYVPCCGHVFIPNAFTPNGDHNNDVFNVKVDRDLEMYQMKIFDRWGKELFSSDDISKGWNGTYKGKQCDMDTYYYMLQIKCSESKIMKGDIQLIR